MHRSLPNTTTDRVRWSVDTRYNAAGEPNGRPHVPGFLARSAAAPGNVVRSAAESLEHFELGALPPGVVASPPSNASPREGAKNPEICRPLFLPG